MYIIVNPKSKELMAVEPPSILMEVSDGGSTAINIEN